MGEIVEDMCLAEIVEPVTVGFVGLSEWTICMSVLNISALHVVADVQSFLRLFLLYRGVIIF